MTTWIRPYQQFQEEAVIAFSLRAWQPVFESMEQVLGRELFVRLHGTDWRAYQEQSIHDVLCDETITVWVAEDQDGRPVGFVAASPIDPKRGLGEITMLAVDPAAQRRGIGTELTEHATAWLAEQGMKVAMVETGGDPGHAPARRTYSRAEYTLLPLARYFKAL